MSIIFHEGLPRSGKSYEAVVHHLIPALKNGRMVVTNIRGIDLAKISDVIGRPVSVLESLFVQVEWDKTRDIVKNIRHNALYLIDELQDFWPSGREKLDEQTTHFITQHGHYGLDIILMGQASSDVHNLWRNRIDKKFYFIKKDAVGKAHQYHWICYKRTAPDKFKFINEGDAPYDEKYFGTYKSHRDETSNKSDYADKRANVWSRPALRYGIPAMVIVCCFSAYFLWSILSGHRSITGNGVKMSPQLIKEAQASQDSPLLAERLRREAAAPASAVAAVPVSGVPVTAPIADVKLDQLAQLVKDFRPRLASVIQGEFDGKKKVSGTIDFYDGSLHRHESLRFQQIEQLGGSIQLAEDDVLLKYRGGETLVTSWPLFDQIGQVSEVAQHSPQLTGQMQ